MNFINTTSLHLFTKSLHLPPSTLRTKRTIAFLLVRNMLHCAADMTVLERQQSRQQWQQQQYQHNYFTDTQLDQYQNLMTNESVVREIVNRSIKVDPGLDNGWPDFGKYPLPGTGYGGDGFGNGNGNGNGNGGMVDYSLSRTSSCPPELPEKMESSLKKRKAQNNNNQKVAEKRSKGDSEEESKVTEQNNSSNSNSNNKATSGDSVKENSKASDVQKQDYIHVRARRGQATDSHSLAERVRREKISERMKYLQDLVPGCNKITGKAGMLDEIINYVQSLQRQVEFLSMKLAAVNPRLDFNVENFFEKELLSATNAGFPINTSEMAPYLLQLNSLQQLVSSCGLDMNMMMNSPDVALQRTRSAPVSDAFLDTSCFTQVQPTWESDLQNLYNVDFNQGRPTTFPPQSFTGILEGNNLKMEM